MFFDSPGFVRTRSVMGVLALISLSACPAWLGLDWNTVGGEYLGEWRDNALAASAWIEATAEVQPLENDPSIEQEFQSATFSLRPENQTSILFNFTITRNLKTSEVGISWVFGAKPALPTTDIVWLKSKSTKKQKDQGGCLLGTVSEKNHPQIFSDTVQWSRKKGLADPSASMQVKDSVSVCLHPGQFSFTLSDGIRFHLTQKTALPSTGASTGPALLLSRDDFQKKVLNQGFDEKIRIQRLYQSYLATQQAYTSVIPKVSVSDVIGLVSQPQFSVIRLIGNWVPFLFPGKWIRVHGSMQRLEVERLSQVIGSANWAYTADGLALNYLRDEEIKFSIQRWLPFFDAYLKRIQTDEKLGLEPPGTSLDWESAVLSLNRAQAVLDQGLAIQRAGMKEAMAGEALLGISPMDPKDFKVTQISEAELQKETAWVKARVLATALELRQMEASIQEAKAEKRARTWDFIDPTSAASGINFSNLISIKSQKAQIQTLELMRSALVERLKRELDTWEIQMLSAQKLWEISAKALSVSQTKMKRLETGLKLGIKISPLEVRILGPELMRLESDEIQTRYEFEALWEKRSRWVMEGTYGDILSQRKP
ncbi:MAG: TolC family protein [Bdellovibrionales bacterium]|nr:TolC family protein [Bdellovibrionales bacterium]